MAGKPEPPLVCKSCTSISCDECLAAFKHVQHGVIERLTIWKTARAALTNDENTWSEDIEITPQDVMNLTLYLESGNEAFVGGGG